MKKVLILMTAAVLLICAGNTMKTSAKEMKTAEVKTSNTHLLTAVNTCTPCHDCTAPPTASLTTTDMKRDISMHAAKVPGMTSTNDVPVPLAALDPGEVNIQVGCFKNDISGAKITAKVCTDVPIPLAANATIKQATGWSMISGNNDIGCSTVVNDDWPAANTNNTNSVQQKNETNAATVMNKSGTHNDSGGTTAMVATCTTGFNLRC